MAVEKIKELLGQVIDESYRAACQKEQAEGYIKLERGCDYSSSWYRRFLPLSLPGSGIMPLLACESVISDTGPFDLLNPPSACPDSSKISPAHSQSGSPRMQTRLQSHRSAARNLPRLRPEDPQSDPSPPLDWVLKEWEYGHWDSPDQRQQPTYSILVELFVYQFASPVRWVERLACSSRTTSSEADPARLDADWLGNTDPQRQGRAARSLTHPQPFDSPHSKQI